MRVCIVAVHGVMPHPRYQIQDQVSAELVKALDSRTPAGQRWVADVLNPPSLVPPTSPPLGYEAKATLTRVHLITPSGSLPSDVYDVLEAYWSPLDKGKTNWRSVLSWLLSTIFVPANTTARYMATWQKTLFDISYVLIAATVALAALAGAIWIALGSLQKIVAIAGTGTDATSTGLSTLFSIIADPSKLGSLLEWHAVVLLAFALVGGFTAMQAVRAFISVCRQLGLLSQIPVQLVSRLIFVVVLLAISGVLFSLAIFIPLSIGKPMGPVALWFALAFGAFEIGRAILESFVANFFGDVQIYTSHDENAEFYALREAMLEVVTGTIGSVTSKTAADGLNPYDRVHILAHSLGSTISMDALIRLYNMTKQARYKQEDFDRIRSFVTFGSSLEKTKYFFDIADPSQSLSYVQWRNDAYGVLFVGSSTALGYPNEARAGIFWMNFWYFLDPIANKIDSYRSVLVPGDDLGDAASIRARLDARVRTEEIVAVGRRICHNEGVPGVINPFVGRFIPHGDYLGDIWFWSGPNGFGVLDIVTSADASTASDANVSAGSPPVKPPSPKRYESMSPGQARWHRDRFGM